MKIICRRTHARTHTHQKCVRPTALRECVNVCIYACIHYMMDVCVRDVRVCVFLCTCLLDFSCWKWTEMARHKWNISLSRNHQDLQVDWAALIGSSTSQTPTSHCMSSFFASLSVYLYAVSFRKSTALRCSYATRKTHCLHDNRSLGRTAISLSKTPRICLKTCRAQEHTCIML